MSQIVAHQILNVHLHPIRDCEDSILLYIALARLTLVSLVDNCTMCILLTPLLYYITTVIIEVVLVLS